MPKQRVRKLILVSSVVDYLKTREINEDHVQFFMKDFAENGKKHDVSVVALPDGNFGLFGGYHSMEALRRLDVKEVMADIHEDLDESEIHLAAVKENLGQKEMSFADKCVNYPVLMEKLHCTQTQLADRLGVQLHSVNRPVATMQNAAPGVFELVRKGILQSTSAVEIAPLSLEQQLSILRKIGDKPVKREIIRRWIKQLKEERKPKRGRKRKGTEASVDGMHAKFEQTDVETMLDSTEKLRRALLWIRHNQMEPTPSNIAVALVKTAPRDKDGPKAA